MSLGFKHEIEKGALGTLVVIVAAVWGLACVHMNAKMAPHMHSHEVYPVTVEKIVAAFYPEIIEKKGLLDFDDGTKWPSCFSDGMSYRGIVSQLFARQKNTIIGLARLLSSDAQVALLPLWLLAIWPVVAYCYSAVAHIERGEPLDAATSLAFRQLPWLVAYPLAPLVGAAVSLGAMWLIGFVARTDWLLVCVLPIAFAFGAVTASLLLAGVIGCPFVLAACASTSRRPSLVSVWQEALKRVCRSVGPLLLLACKCAGILLLGLVLVALVNNAAVWPVWIAAGGSMDYVVYFIRSATAPTNTFGLEGLPLGKTVAMHFAALLTFLPYLFLTGWLTSYAFARFSAIASPTSNPDGDGETRTCPRR